MNTLMPQPLKGYQRTTINRSHAHIGIHITYWLVVDYAIDSYRFEIDSDEKF